MKKTIIFLAIVIAAIVAVMILPAKAETKIKREEPPLPVQTDLQRRQEIWVSALEWCESKGKIQAINPKDRDGTPSFGAFQFKPSTYAYFAKSYGMASTTDYMNHETQRKIVIRMIDDKSVVWTQQFPDCVKNKVGMPPVK